jgi:hypothetical protein
MPQVNDKLPNEFNNVTATVSNMVRNSMPRAQLSAAGAVREGN